jgi:hypothetical protein
VSWLIESPAYLLSPDDVVLFAWWVEITMPHMQRVHAIDSSMIERARALRRAADRILAVSQLRQGLAETISRPSLGSCGNGR